MTKGELVRTFNGTAIEQRNDDGYMDATAMCRATGKLFADYWRNKTTQEFILAMTESMGIPIDSLVQSRVGRSGGSWVHPRVAMHLAQWCSPKFAVVVSGWVLDILTTGKTEVVPAKKPGGLTDMAWCEGLLIVIADGQKMIAAQMAQQTAAIAQHTAVVQTLVSGIVERLPAKQPEPIQPAAHHRQPRTTNADRERESRYELRLQPNRTNAQIAESVSARGYSVCAGTVGKYRKLMEQAGEIAPQPVRTTKAGWRMRIHRQGG